MSAWPLYRAILRRYRSQPPPLWAPAFRLSVDVLVRILQWRRRIQFPARGLSEWWWTSRWRFEILMRWHDREALEFCGATLRPGMIVVDVGAHMGYYTRLFAELVGPAGQVLAIEPQPENLIALRHNVSGRRYRNVQISAHAAGDQHREATLHWSPGSTNHSLAPGFTDCVDKSIVTIQPLDDLLADFPRIDFLKIDVEGAEPLVLAGLTKTIARNPDLTILIESNAKALAAAGTSPENLRAQLTAMGLQIRTLNEESPGTENWICARN